MIVSSRPVMLAALVIALGVHGGAVLNLFEAEQVQIEAGSGAAEVRLGNAFADMAAGALSAETPETITPETVTPETIAPEPAAASTPVKAAQFRETDSPKPTIEPLKPAQAEVMKAEQLPKTPGAEVLHNTPIETEATPPPPAKTAETTPEEKAEPSGTQLTGTLRPRRRPANLAATASKPQPQTAKEAPKDTPAKTARGQSNTNSRAGEAAGTRAATARSKGNGGRAQAAGNAAASNYPGQVMRRISRVRKPRVGTRGSATVSFSVAANGALARVGLTRSSGSARLDQAALQVIRRAAPFPKPPPGARRSFSIQIKGE